MLNIKSLIAGTVLVSVAAVSFAQAPATAAKPATPVAATATAATPATPAATTDAVAKSDAKKVKHVKHAAKKSAAKTTTEPAAK